MAFIILFVIVSLAFPVMAEVARNPENNLLTRSMLQIRLLSYNIFDRKKPLFESKEFIGGAIKVVDYVRGVGLLVIAIIILYYVVLVLSLLIGIFLG